MRVRAATRRVTVHGLVMAVAAAAPLTAQDRPRVGFGFGGGTILGAELIEHRFQTQLDSAMAALIQEVNVTDMVVADVHAEWYLSDHFALRAHAAWGRGRLEAKTRRADGGDEVTAQRLSSGFGRVGMFAIDAGISVWPWTPRTVGFAPFITIGYGMFSYDFGDAANGGNAFFRARGARRGQALVVGAGADLRVWDPVVLRIEAVNHMVESPLRSSDFAIFGQRRPSSTGGAARVSNVRLVLGAHIYFPFDDGM